MFDMEHLNTEVKQSEAPLAKCFQSEMEALTKRAKAAQKTLLHIYSSLPLLEDSYENSFEKSVEDSLETEISEKLHPLSSTASITSDLGQSMTESSADSLCLSSSSTTPSSVASVSTTSEANEKEFHGTLYKWVEGKNFGFIKCSKLNKDVFVHVSNLVNPDMQVPSEVLFCLAQDKKSKKDKAVHVRLPGTTTEESMVEEIQGEQLHGTLYKWIEDKHFGWIYCPKLKKDIFVHDSALMVTVVNLPMDVTFNMGYDKKAERSKATNVRRPRGTWMSWAV